MSDAVIEVDVRALASGGAGVADLPDGRVAFVPRSAPGDRARIRLRKSKPRWAHAELVELLTPGEDRRQAPCPYFDRCGGCQLQHVAYAAQRAWKGRFVSDALTRIGGQQDVEPPEVVPSPREREYRSRVTFTLRRLRGGRVVAGLHELDKPSRVLDVERCLLPAPALTEAWTAIRRGWGPGARLLPAGGRLKLLLRRVGDGVDLTVIGGEDGWRADDLASSVGALRSIRHAPGGSEPRTVWGPTDGPGSAFEQVNLEAAALLRARLLELTEELEPSTAVDAYCGVGALGRALAERGWRVRGIESDAQAVAIAEADPLEGFEIDQGWVEERMSAALPARLVVLNPPRTGVNPDALLALQLSPPERILYVSCDPATLARDIAVLDSTFRLVRVEAFDLFPQTAHVEAIAVLEPRG